MIWLAVRKSSPRPITNITSSHSRPLNSCYTPLEVSPHKTKASTMTARCYTITWLLTPLNADALSYKFPLTRRMLRVTMKQKDNAANYRLPLGSISSSNRRQLDIKLMIRVCQSVVMNVSSNTATDGVVSGWATVAWSSWIDCNLRLDLHDPFVLK